MNDLTTMGWLPAWIIGAPLVLAIFDWIRTPKPARDRDPDAEYRRDAARMSPMPAAQR
jgi:hypothetical protein